MTTLDSDDLDAIEALIAAAIGTPVAKDGQAATVAGMLSASYDRIERNAGYDRLPIYGNDKLFDIDGTEAAYATFPCIVYDDDASNWRCYYITRVGGVRLLSMRTSTDGKTSWSAPTVILSPNAGELNIWTAVVWRESAVLWRMLYTGYGATIGIYYATSPNGIDTWTRENSGNKVITPNEDWDIYTTGGIDYHTREVTGVMKVASRYYIYNCSIQVPGVRRKIGVAWTDDFVTFTQQSAPVFGDVDNSLVAERFSSYYSASPFSYNGYYWLAVSKYGPGAKFSTFELWYSTDPLFPANNRFLAKVIQRTSEGADFPNRDIDVITFGTDDITQTTLVHAGNEFRMYFGALHQVGTGSSLWYVALATATYIWDAIRGANDNDERTRKLLPQTRWTVTQADIVDAVHDETLSGHTTAGSAGKALSDLATDVYDAEHDFSRGDTTDEHRVSWNKNGTRQTTVTTPTIQILDNAGVELLAATAMTDLGSGDLRYDASGAARMTSGESYKIVLVATIDSASRTWVRLVSRDATVNVSLSQAAAQVASIVEGSTITVQRGDTTTISLTGLGDISARTKLWFTAKASREHTDAQALILATEAAGLLTIAGRDDAAGETCTITVTNAVTGAVTIVLSAAATKALPITTGEYDLQMLTASGVSTLTESGFAVVSDVTQAIT